LDFWAIPAATYNIIVGGVAIGIRQREFEAIVQRGSTSLT